MIEKKGSIGIMLCGLLYLIFAALLLPAAIRQIVAILQSVSRISTPATNHDPSGLDILLLALIGSVFTVLPSLIMTIISIGLFRLSNKIRILMLIANSCFIIFLIFFLLALTQAYRDANPSLFYIVLIFVALGLFIFSTYYFTRSRIKEQFK